MDDELTLALALVVGDESSFDEHPLQPGVHLRWSFSRFLPYPSAGFRIERLLPWDGEFPTWEPVTTVKLPTADPPIPDRRARSIGEVRARIERRLSGAFEGRHDDIDHGALVDMLLPTWPSLTADVELPSPSGRGPKISAKKLELLELSALDRRAALAIGLSWVDPLPSGVRADYRVTGL